LQKNRTSATATYIRVRTHVLVVSLSMVRFLHTSDWQLGMTRHFLKPGPQARFTDARIDAIRTIGRIAREEECSFVAVAGDVFESNLVDRSILSRALEAMREPAVPFYLLPGNHDPLSPGSLWLSPQFTTQKPANVHVLDETNVEVAPGSWLVGAPYRSRKLAEDPLAAALERAARCPGHAIVIGHGQVDSLVPDVGQSGLISSSLLESALRENHAAYVGLGDRHSRTAIGESGMAWYSGAPEPTDYDEDDPGWVLIVDVDEQGTEVRPVRTSTWRFVRELFAFGERGDVSRLRAWLDGLTAKDRTIVKLSFTGTLNLAARTELDTVLDHYSDTFAAIERWERHTDLAIVADDTDFHELGLNGFAAIAATELATEAAGTGPLAAVAQDALALLHRLSRGAA
jgi:DNA repair exonuclease SbcCD nuclease subunit